MARTLGELTVEEFEELVERTIDNPFEVWLTQLMHASDVVSDEKGDGFRPEFAASLRRCLEQAGLGKATAVRTMGDEARP